MNNIVRLDYLGTTTITNPTDSYMTKLTNDLTKGLIQNLLGITFEHVSANQEFYGLDGITTLDKAGVNRKITSTTMLELIKSSLQLISAHITNKASTKEFLNSLSNEEQLELLLFAEYIFSGMAGVRQNDLMREWERQTDASDDMRKEILKVIANIRGSLTCMS
mgnify:FL=1|tara:strand:+ start:541 stop:1032 length:492 start_codon:yes stop_codon:yes gene_type:complete